MAVQGYGVDKYGVLHSSDVSLYASCANPSVSRWYRIRTSSPQETAAMPGAAAEIMAFGSENAFVDLSHTACLNWLPWTKKTLIVRSENEFTVDAR